MKLTIVIDVDIKYDRRKLNNILAHANPEIHAFITKAAASELNGMETNGNQEYWLQVKIEE